MKRYSSCWWRPHLALWSVVLAVSAQAKVCVWTGKGEQNPSFSNNLLWSDEGNWVDGNVPEDGDTVSFTECGTGVHRIGKALTLENLYYTNKVGGTFNSAGQKLTLTGTESVVHVSEKIGLFFNPVHLPEGARLTIDNSAQLEFRSKFAFSGSGEVIKTGGGQVSHKGISSPDFHGTWNWHGGQLVVFSDIDRPLGSERAKACFHGTSVAFRYGGVHDNGFELHDASVLTYRAATFNGDLKLVSETRNSYPFFLQGVMDKDYYSPDSPPSIILNGSLSCDNSRYSCRPLFYSYCATLPDGVDEVSFAVRLNGEVDLGKVPLETLHRKVVCQEGVHLYVNRPISTTHSTGVILYCKDRLFCGTENVIGPRNLVFGAADSGSSVVFDMCGHDQAVAALILNESEGHTTEASITSSAGPALMSTATHDLNSLRVPSLDGESSLRLRKGSLAATGDFVFSGGTTTGWIISDYPGCDLTGAAFSSLSGIAPEGAGIVRVGAVTALGKGIKLDFIGRTTGCLQVAPGVNVEAARVFDLDVDVPAGVYCRRGAGVEGAVEADWLGGDGCDGTVTVAEHTPSLIWTGTGDRTLTGAENWGAKTSPDLADPDLILDFRRATAEVPVILSGAVAPACAMVSGDVPEGNPVFAGDGSLSISGASVATNGFVFSEEASFEWKGPGTLYLKGASSSSGTLRVNGGRVVILPGASWPGDVSVDAGAVLEVAGGRAASAFSEKTRLRLDGTLELGFGVAESVAALVVDGSLAKRLKEYGAGVSTHFAGSGTVVSFAANGLRIIVK